MGCTVRTKKIVVFGIGVFLLVVGLFLGGFMIMIVDAVLKSQLALSVGSTSYNNWIELPIPMYMEFHLFNVTNAEDYKNDLSIKPMLEEKGPYVYREYHKRKIISWNADNTVTFQTVRTWEYDENSSVGPETDVFTTVNVVAARNGSETYDGVFNMYTGADNIERLGVLSEWNYKNYSPYYDQPCSDVFGTTGELWPPIKSKDDVGIFSPDVCSSLKMSYSGSAENHGLEGYGYFLKDSMFDVESPDAQCFCKSGTDCVPTGLLNVSACRFDAPVFISRPHFLLSDPQLLDAIQGLQPDPEKHNFTLGLEPVTGMPLFVNARLMLSVMLEPVQHISLFDKANKTIYFPTFWFNQKAVLSEELASLAKLVKMAPDIGMGVFFGLAGIGALLLFIGIMLTVRHGWKGSEGDTLIQK